MNNIKIQNLISDGENLKLEFKQSFDKEDIETITVFANAKGGVLLVGVKDSGETLDVSVGAETIQNSNHQMNLTEIANMHLQRLQLSWDAYESVDSEFDDLDDIKIDKFFTKVNQNGRFKLSDDRVQNLKKLNLIKSMKPTNAAKLLFAKEQNIYNIHIGRFKTPSMILDEKMIRLPLFEAVEETMYRDYTSPIDTQIKIFDNSITFFNPGRLYGDMTIEKLSTDNYQAQTRNKLIAEAFYLTGDIEKYGSGYIRIRQAVSEYPTMKLKYEEMGNGYLVTISYE